MTIFFCRVKVHWLDNIVVNGLRDIARTVYFASEQRRARLAVWLWSDHGVHRPILPSKTRTNLVVENDITFVRVCSLLVRELIRLPYSHATFTIHSFCYLNRSYSCTSIDGSMRFLHIISLLHAYNFSQVAKPVLSP
jgi:hypothetical protein